MKVQQQQQNLAEQLLRRVERMWMPFEVRQSNIIHIFHPERQKLNALQKPSLAATPASTSTAKFTC